MTLFLVLALVVTFAGGRLTIVWYILALATAMNAVADLLFSYTTAVGLYYGGTPLDVLYVYAYILFALALHEHTRIL